MARSRPPKEEPAERGGMAGLFEQAGAHSGSRARRLSLVATDPAVEEYMKSLRPSNCLLCKRLQKTPRGEPMVCPRCMKKGATVDRPTIPMAVTKGRR